MKTNKLNQLFRAARQEPAPAPDADFAAAVLRAIRREPAGAGVVRAAGVLPQLERWFPRLSVAALALIVLCAAAEWAQTEAGAPDLAGGAAQATSQYLFNVDNL